MFSDSGYPTVCHLFNLLLKISYEYNINDKNLLNVENNEFINVDENSRQ